MKSKSLVSKSVLTIREQGWRVFCRKLTAWFGRKIPRRRTSRAASAWEGKYREGGQVCTERSVPNDPVDYTQHPFLYQNAIGKPVTGRLDGVPLYDIMSRWMSPSCTVLSIGCGLAFIEEDIVRSGWAKSVTAYELSQTAVDQANARIAEAGLADRLQVKCGNVLKENLPDQSFDAILVVAAIHHFFETEEMFKLMHRVLKPGGLLIYDEYVGPDHHVYEDFVIAAVNEVNECLDPQYRYHAFAEKTREKVKAPTIKDMLEHDPSEGVHASQILPLTYQYFDVLERADYGGTLLRPFFTAILPNFNWEDPKDQTVARLIILIERILLRTARIPHYHTEVVARKRSVPRPKLGKTEVERINYEDWRGPDADMG